MSATEISQPGDPVSPSTASPGEARDAAYAGFWRRVGAALADGVILAVPLAVGTYFLFPAQVLSRSQNPPEATASYLLFLVVYLAVVVAYMAGMESSALQATLGKRVLKIQVTDLERQRISFLRAVKRGWFYWLPVALSLIDVLAQFMVFQAIAALFAIVSCAAVAFTERRQALHDITAGCLVLHRPATPG